MTGGVRWAHSTYLPNHNTNILPCLGCLQGSVSLRKVAARYGLILQLFPVLVFAYLPVF